MTKRMRWTALLLGPLSLLSMTGMRAAGDDMDLHMKMTAIKPKQPGDQARADGIVTDARKVAERYKDYREALAAGYAIFMPDQKQGVYHFVRETGIDGPFDASKPPALLYEKAGTGYKLVGVMYMAPYGATEAELNERVPLSIGQWHAHVNLCAPSDAGSRNWLLGDKTFGLDGSIATADACRAAGGMFLRHLAGWMVHVYPYETDPAKVWAAGTDDDHLVGHDAMRGMKM